MPLCEYLNGLNGANMLSIIISVQRTEALDRAIFYVSCRSCGTVHSIDVPASERPPTYVRQPFEEFWGWLISTHVPREDQKARDIKAMLISQTLAEARGALIEMPAGKAVVETANQTTRHQKLAA